jgi:copper homeostasis protein
MILEICVDDPVSLRAAISGGADRIELCNALALGGLTPSEGFVRMAAQADLPVHAMVRPRAGDFNYDADEIALIADDVRRLAALGVAGVVVGAATQSGTLDERSLARFRDAAKDTAITLHRVIDLTPDPIAAARTAAKLGYDYVLTSGGAPRAQDGKAVIARMVSETAGQLTVIAASGITAKNVAAIIHDTGATQIHTSASQACDWADPRIVEFGFATSPRRVAVGAHIAALKQAIADNDQGTN